VTTDTKPRAPTDAEIIALMGDPRYSTIGTVREAISRWGQLYTTPQPAQAQAIQGVQWQCGPQASGFTPPQPTLVQAGAVPLTDEQKNAMWVAATIELPSPQNCYLRGMADAERAHGIGIKGGQHGAE